MKFKSASECASNWHNLFNYILEFEVVKKVDIYNEINV